MVCVPTFDKLIVAGFDEEVVIGAAGLIDQFILFDTKSEYIVLSDTWIISPSHVLTLLLKR